MKKLLTILFVSASYLSLAQANIQLLDQYFDSLEKYNQGMGGIAIFEEGKIRYTTDMGYSSISPKVANSKKTKYRIGSISKTFTAVAIMQTIEEGKLSLDTKISTFFPSLPKADLITVEHLLRHRSGIYNFTDTDNYFSFNQDSMKREDHLALFKKNGLVFPPDSTFSYSNSGYVLLAYILEDIDQKPYGKVIQDRIAKPLKLKSTYHAVAYDTRKKEAYSYAYNGTWMDASKTNGMLSMGAGSLVSHPRDLVRFFNALENSQLVSQDTYNTMKTWKDDYGMGLFPIERNGLAGYGHTGGIDGFQSVLFVIPEKGVIVAYCANGVNQPRKSIVETALQFYFGEKTEPISFEQKVIELEEDQLEPLVGTYHNAKMKMSMEIRIKNGHLEAQADGQGSFPLDALNENTFIFNGAGIKLVFNEKAENSFVLYQNGFVLDFVRVNE